MKLIFKSGFFLLLLLFGIPQASAQDRVITGTVRDSASNVPMSFCNVGLLKSGLGASTDAKGNFVLAIPSNASSPRLIVSYLGYKTDTIELKPAVNEYIVLLANSPGIMNELVVTGVSKATLIKENPVSIISISAKAIDQTTGSNIIDVLVKNAPGLNAVKTGPNISKPFIRGLGYNRVLSLYDGIRQEGQQWGDEHGLEVDPYNISRAEVIKGPASLMYGSDALAGVVSMMPFIPTDTSRTLQGRFVSEYQSNNGLYGNGIRLGYGNPRWSFFMRGSYRIAKNYTNRIDGRVYNTNFRETNFSAGIQYTGASGYSTINFTVYNGLQGIPDGSRDSLSRKFTMQTSEGLADDIKNRPIVPDNELNSYALSPLHQHIQHYRIYSNNHYEAGEGEINFLLALQQNIRREYNHPTMPQQAGMFVRLNTLNYGISYNAPPIRNTEISLGLNGMYQNNQNKNATDFPIPDYNLLDIGAYFFAKWKYERWTISGGARGDIRYLQGTDFYIGQDTLTGFSNQAFLPDTAGAYLQFPAFRKTFKGISMSIGTTFRINKHLNLKANIARGYRAPNITEFASNGLDPGAHIVYLGNRTFVPEFSLQEDIEAGLSYSSISASVSFFNNNIRNYIYLQQLTDANGEPLINAQGNKTFEYQQAAARLYGGEASVIFHPEFIHGFSFSNTVSILYGYNRKAEFENRGINGEYLPLIPPMQISSSLNQEIKINSGFIPNISLMAGMEYNAAQNRYLALSNTETFTPSYALFSFQINSTIRFRKKQEMQFQIQVNNLFDTAYQSNLSRLKYFEYYSASPNASLGMFGMGRNICAKLILPF